ncbi:MAG: EamA family transporter [Dokdonella sp.]|uniref:DMT family transporter n=1 Tax=Dokdonella sp. TaxID=2291710 RepID=UPI003266EB0A
MTQASTSRRAALIALAFPTLIWSYNWIVMKQALQFSGPFEFSALRYVGGTIVLFAVLLVRRESLRPPPLVPTAMIGLAQTLGFQLLVQWALVDGGAGKTALLAYSMPFWLVLFGWLVWKVRPAPRLIAGLAVAGIGLVLVLEPWLGLGDGRSSLLALAGGFAWAIGVSLSKRLFERGGINVLSLTAWQMLIGSAGMVVIALLVPERPIEWSNAFIAALLYNTVLASGLAWLLWSFVVAELPANVAGLSSLVIPIAGVAFAWALLGERPSPVECVGIVFIAVALLLVNWRSGEAQSR